MTENLVFGIRPVVEAIEAGKQIEKLYIRKGAEGQLMTELRDLCLRHRIRTQDVIGGEALASNQSLYLTIYYKEAAPKCISGSTSYLRV